MKLITKNLTGRTPLNHQLVCRTATAKAYIQLDCRFGGELSAGPSRGLIPDTVNNRLAVRWILPAEITGDSLRALVGAGCNAVADRQRIEGIDDNFYWHDDATEMDVPVTWGA